MEKLETLGFPGRWHQNATPCGVRFARCVGMRLETSSLFRILGPILLCVQYDGQPWDFGALLRLAPQVLRLLPQRKKVAFRLFGALQDGTI